MNHPDWTLVMPPTSTSRFSEVMQLLASLVEDGQVLSARFEVGGLVAMLSVQPSVAETVATEPAGSTETASPRFLDLSQIEKTILQVVTGEWQTAQELADKCGQSKSTYFCAILSNLSDRGALDSGRNGYRLGKGVPVPLEEPLRRGKELSAIEESILQAATAEWQTAQEFSITTGQKCGHWFYAILGNLADREYLESSRNGYRLPAAAPDPVSPSSCP
jgi:hypothetical protein